ncbi:mitochondrial-targeted muts 1, partial [Micractinium conductrix]
MHLGRLLSVRSAGQAWAAGLARPALWPHSLRCAASRAGGVTTVVADRVNKEVAEYWQQVLNTSVDKPTAPQVLGLQAALGVESGSDEGDGEDAVRNGSAAPAPSRRAAFSSRSGRPPLYTYFRGVKKQHPKSVVLVRVGEFYEAVGIDAVLLVQHAGLNPMASGAGRPPRAGCPRQNLRRTVADLVAAGLSVVVCEETPEGYSYGSMRTKQKQRFVAAVVTPANPHLLHGLVDEDADLPIDAAPPLLALVPQVGGYTVLEVSVDLATVSVMEGLTEDAVYARLHEGGLAPPLFLHVPTPSAAADRRLSEGTFEREWEQRVSTLFRSQVGVVERYSDPDPLEGLLTRIRSMLGLSASEHFTVIRASARDRPRPLYHSTALNLGLHKARGQPCLLDYLLPPASPLPARRWLRRLLLLPPPPATAVAIHRACAILAGITEPVPAFPLVPAASVVLKLRAHEANDIFFRELGELCAAVRDLLSRDSPQMRELADSLLGVACREMGVNEMPLKGKVKESVLASQMEQASVELARNRVQRELEAAYVPVLQAWQAEMARPITEKDRKELAKERPLLQYDSANNALWLRVKGRKNADAFMLRNFSSDSPLEGRSAFAVEMTEMRYVLDDVTPRSLVLVDELGKGTE